MIVQEGRRRVAIVLAAIIGERDRRSRSSQRRRPAGRRGPRRRRARRPKNVILFIGDGMGPEQVEIGRRVKGAPLFIDGIPWGATGSLNTDSLEGVTDSAAGATALATGYETNNGWLSMIPTEPEPTSVETVLERAEDRGKATGLFSTGDLPDATAGAFAAHVTDRGEDEEVARQMGEQGIEFLLGGRGGGASRRSRTSRA